MVKMLGLLSFLSLTTISCTNNISSVSSSVFKTNQSDNIINGEFFEKDNVLQKATVAVYDVITGQLCSGSLLPNNIVITAAHCVGPYATAMYIIFDKEVKTNSTFRPVDKVKVSEYWDSSRSAKFDSGDIALLHYVGQTPDDYAPLPLLNSDGLLKNNAEVIIAGYGVKEATNAETAGQLRFAKVKISNSKYSDSELSIDQSKGQGACHGDSGGPAFLKINNKYFVWGVASRGYDPQTGHCSFFSVYTSTVYYRGWIDRNAKQLARSLVSNSTQ